MTAAAIIDLGLVERLIAVRMESALGDSVALKRYAGEEQPEQTSGAEKPWVEVVGLDARWDIGNRTGGTGSTDDNDLCGFTLALTLGVPDTLTRARGYALSSLISRVRAALGDTQLDSEDGAHRVTLFDLDARTDRDPDPSRRARTASVVITGEVQRTSGATLES